MEIPINQRDAAVVLDLLIWLGVGWSGESFFSLAGLIWLTVQYCSAAVLLVL
jgi:hypothetical protein